MRKLRGTIRTHMIDTERKEALERLKNQMREAGITSAELARMMGVARQQTYRWTNGLQEMSLKRWEEAAKYLGVHPAALLFGSDTPAFNDDKLVKVLTEINTILEDEGASLTPTQVAKIAVESYKTDTNIKFLIGLASSK